MIALYFLMVLPMATWAVETPVPERFLQPRDFNPHPLTDVKRPGPTYKQLRIPGPADIYSHYLQNREPAYKGQEYNQYGAQELQERLHTEATHSKFTEEQQRENDLSSHSLYASAATPHFQVSNDYADVVDTRSFDEHVPKQYAFAYSVLDHHSGDDFSHAQKHDGHSTEGQYRVKLPDGRVQVVRYTADKGGYRAKVSYEPAEVAPLVFKATYPTPISNHYTQVPYTPTSAPTVYTASPTVTPSLYTATPAVYHSVTPTAYAPVTTPYPYTTATFQHYYPSAHQHFGLKEPKVQIDYNGGGHQVGAESTIQQTRVVYQQHHVYKRDN